MLLLGVPLFFAFRMPVSGAAVERWPRKTLLIAAFATAIASLAALVLQTAVMAGSLGEAVKPASLSFMVTGTALGMAMVVRAAAALLGLVALVALKPGRALWSVTTALGLIVAASFAWTGHGAATEGPGGPIHLVANIIHAVAAALWLGALAALTALLLRRAGPDDLAIHRALHGFAGLGTLAVLVLVLTGLVNSWFLIGPERVASTSTASCWSPSSSSSA